MLQEMTVDATVENIRTVTEFVDGILEASDCPMKAQMQIDIAIDELFGNIARYAYGDAVGQATMRAGYSPEDGAFTMVLIDRGMPYDPLAKSDPDVTLAAEDRPIGGLGVYMVKKTMDDIQYAYEDGQNILTVTKKY